MTLDLLHIADPLLVPLVAIALILILVVCIGVAAKAWARAHRKPDQQFLQAQRVARQATRQFRRRQRLRGPWFRFF